MNDQLTMELPDGRVLFHELDTGEAFTSDFALTRGHRFTKAPAQSNHTSVALDERGMEWLFSPNAPVYRVEKGDTI